MANLIGQIKKWPTEVMPAGHLLADGSAVSRVTYATLFAVIGVKYGAGDGSTTFNVPDYRGVVVRGVAHGSATDPDRASRTNRGDGTTGDNVGTRQLGQNRSHRHTHPLGSNTLGLSGSVRAGNAGIYTPHYTTDTIGDNESRPSNTYINRIIQFELT